MHCGLYACRKPCSGSLQLKRQCRQLDQALFYVITYRAFGRQFQTRYGDKCLAGTDRMFRLDRFLPDLGAIVGPGQGREAASGRRYMQYAAEESCKLNATRCGWRSINSFLGDPGKIEPVTQRYSFLGTCRHSGSNLLHEEPMSSTGLISQAVRQCAPESLLGSRRSASPWADAAPSWSRCAIRRPVLSSTEGRRQHRGAAWRA